MAKVKCYLYGIQPMIMFTMSSKIYINFILFIYCRKYYLNLIFIYLALFLLAIPLIKVKVLKEKSI